MSTANADFGQGRDALQSNYTAAAQPWQTLFGQSQGGANAYGDATGANGADGLARAKSNFQASPGFDFALNTGIDALSRAGVARGQAVGNTLHDAQTFGNGLANQEYGSYVSRLQPYLGQGTAAAGGIAGVNTGLGNQLNSNLTGQGQLGYTAQTGIGDANASADLARYSASGNMWGALMGAGRLAAGAFGGGGGLGGMFGGGAGNYGGSPDTNPNLRPF